MKLKHWVGLAFIVIGGLFVLHLTMSHGGLSGFKSGIGLGGQ
jgi:hypothetical protein